MAAPVLVVLLMAMGGRAMDQDGAQEASLGASSGEASPFLVLATPPEPKTIDSKAMLHAEIRAMKADGDFKAPQIMMPKWRPPFPDTRQATEDVSLKVKPIDWNDLAVDGRKNAAAFPHEVFVQGGSREQELADAETGDELPKLSEMEKTAKKEPTEWALELKKATQLSVLAADIQECKAAKALCFKGHQELYAGMTKDEKKVAHMQEKKCKPIAKACRMKATLQRIRVCDKMALDALEAAKKPKVEAAKEEKSAYSSSAGGEAAAVETAAVDSYSSSAARKLLTENNDVLVEALPEFSSRKILSYSSDTPVDTPVIPEKQEEAKIIDEEFAALKKGDGEFVTKGLATPAAKLTPKADIATYTSAQLDSFEYKLSSDRARVTLPEIEGIFGHAAYAKVVCHGAVGQCDTGGDDCKQMLKACRSEVGKVKEVLCEMKRPKKPPKDPKPSTAADSQPESEVPKPK